MIKLTYKTPPTESLGKNGEILQTTIKGDYEEATVEDIRKEVERLDGQGYDLKISIVAVYPKE